jgi:putative redox protein
MAGKKQVRVQATWQEGYRFEASNDTGQTIIMDSPLAEGGPQGPSPMQLLLQALAGCTAMDVISILRKKRQDVTGFHVNVTGDRVDEHPRYYHTIEMEFIVRGRNIDPAAVERSIELSSTKYCSASANLREKSNIVTRFRIEEED